MRGLLWALLYLTLPSLSVKRRGKIELRAMGVGAACLAIRAVSLGVDRCHASVIPQGRGFVRAAHGVLPVPAPATVRILEGVPVRMTEIEAELTTPTGAALLKALCDTIGDPVGIRPRRTAVATGTRDLAERPNVLRAVLGEPLAGEGAGTVEVSSAVDCSVDTSLMRRLLG